MKRFWPLLLIFIGLFFLCCGFLYDAIVVGIPYQDPPPEILANYIHQTHIASVIYRIGFGISIFGIIASLTQWTIRRFWKKS